MGEQTEYVGGLVSKNNKQVTASPHQSAALKTRDNKSAGGRKSAGGMSPFTHQNGIPMKM